MSQEINFSSLNIPIPNIVKTYPIEKQREIFEYLSEMDELNKNGYKIAFNHLESSFDICRSNGFKEWQNSKSSK
jgi:predicted deacetylase